MPSTPTQIGLGAVVLFALVFAWTVAERSRWRSLLGTRFIYGVPWGTVVTVAIVVAFYLLVQGGLRHWSEPLTLPFVTWSLFYPTGLLTAGIAHGSPEHLTSNVAGTLAVAPIAEYAWSHYPAARSASDEGGEVTGGRPDGIGRALTQPWIRAVMVFPTALFAVAFLTALFSLGPGLGFSGAVFALLGFAVVTYPLSTVVAVVAASALQTLVTAFSQPIVREAIEVETPAPPEWAAIGFQAHLLGFLVGALLGIALLRRRGRFPAPERLFAAIVLVGLVQALWLLVAPVGDDEFVLYRGVGVAFVFLLAMVLTVAAAGSSRSLPRPLSVLPRAPTRRQLAIGWLALVALGVALGLVGAVLGQSPLVPTVVALIVGAILLALPAIPPVAPDRLVSSPVTRRQAAVAAIAVLAVLIAAPGIVLGLTVVEDGAVPESTADEVVVGDYTVTYAENVTSEQTSIVDVDDEDPVETTQSGVIVVNEDRELWAVPVRAEILEYERTATVRVGDVGWRETVHVERTGWDVAGNESAYVVDLEVDGETTRAFASDPIRAHATIDDREFVVDPADEGFDLRVLEDDSTVAETRIPPAGETTTVDDLRVSVASVDGTDRVMVESDGTSVEVAHHEEYPQADES